MLLFLTPLCTLVANFCVLVVAKSSALLIAKNSALLLTDYKWIALPLIHLAGSQKPGDQAWEEIQYPVAHRMLEKCDAVLRLEGASKGADEDVRKAKERGLPVYYRLEDVPDAE